LSRYSEGTAEALASQPADALAEALYYLPDQMALLNAAGHIVFVNSAWMRFAADNNGSPERVGVGMRYLDVCGPSPVRDDGLPEKPSVSAQLYDLLQGRIDSFYDEYPCHSPTAERWFIMRATRLKRGGAIVVHSDITARKRAELELIEQATKDPLTKLLNRRGLSSRLSAELSRMRRGGHSCSALLLDCDDFKTINDRYGYVSGDLVLSRIAVKLNDNLRPEDIIARIGGDEFLVILPNSNVAEACAVAERLRMAIHNRPLDASLGTLKVSVSISVASLHERISSLDGVLERCQAALRFSKTTGKNRTTAMETPTPFREHTLALRAEQSALVIEPVHDLRSNAPAHRRLFCEGQPGTVDASDSIAEHAATARELQDFDAACFRKCLDAVGTEQGALTHLQLSPSTLLAVGPEAVTNWIPTGISPGSLCINFAEPQIFGPPPAFASSLRHLRSFGLKIGMTHVGFGRNSLENLIVFEPDSVMLHPRFGSNLESDFSKARMLERLVRAASALGIEVIVTGVTTEDDLRIAKNLHATHAVGPVFAQKHSPASLQTSHQPS
jgi:diguanylate cyclase (GGDEF)-like protein